jgi:hypothetical protein
MRLLASGKISTFVPASEAKDIEKRDVFFRDYLYDGFRVTAKPP